MNIFGIYALAFKKYGTFNGRSQRKEYWTFTLVNIIILLILYYLSIIPIIPILFSLVILVPTISVSVRRYHDVGLPGFWAIIILVIIFMVPTVFYAQIIVAFVLLFISGRVYNNPAFVLLCVSLTIYSILLLINIIITLKKGTDGENKFGSNQNCNE